MKRQTIGRFIAILAGAAVMFGLEIGLNVQIYYAIPAGLAVYLGLRLGFGLLWDPDRTA
jgi:hypothetical protein